MAIFSAQSAIPPHSPATPPIISAIPPDEFHHSSDDPTIPRDDSQHSRDDPAIPPDDSHHSRDDPTIPPDESHHSRDDLAISPDHTDHSGDNPAIPPMIPSQLKESDYLKAFAFFSVLAAIGWMTALAGIGGWLGALLTAEEVNDRIVGTLSMALTGILGIIVSYFLFRLAISKFIVPKITIQSSSAPPPPAPPIEKL